MLDADGEVELVSVPFRGTGRLLLVDARAVEVEVDVGTGTGECADIVLVSNVDWVLQELLRQKHVSELPSHVNVEDEDMLYSFDGGRVVTGPSVKRGKTGSVVVNDLELVRLMLMTREQIDKLGVAEQSEDIDDCAACKLDNKFGCAALAVEIGGEVVGVRACTTVLTLDILPFHSLREDTIREDCAYEGAGGKADGEGARVAKRWMQEEGL